MKKTLVFAVILALLLPAAAFAATEFTLGGFVKLDSFWDSSQAAKNLNTPIARENNIGAGALHHGRMKFTAQGSRFNFTIKGPDLWGAKTTGYIEMDFDAAENGTNNQAIGASQSYTPRLRHAMFRFNWPTTELLFGQYWSMFCEFYNESVQDGPLQGHGMPTARLAQVRVTQKLPEGFSVAALIGEPNSIVGGFQNTGISTSGETAETPQIQAKLQYEQDLWGKAAYYGRPMPFTARVIGGIQRNNMTGPVGIAGSTTFGQNVFGATNALSSIGNHTYLTPWMIMGNVFIPVIPTHSANLAGTASLSAQWFVGQGLGAFGEQTFGQDVYAQFNNLSSRYNYEQRLYNRYGGYIQGQYYFTNHWFTNVTWGMEKIFNVSQDRNIQLVTAANPGGYTFAGADSPNFWQEVDFTLWYRPITAIKFGLQYAWSQTRWMQSLSSGVVGQNTSNSGTASRVEFVGYFYF
jgi:hypothetical protein